MEYFCDLCNKFYSSYQSLWIHNKKFHNNNESVNTTNDKKKIKCKYCTKVFKHLQSRWRHEKNCDQKYSKDIEIIKLKEEIKLLKNNKKTFTTKIINNNFINGDVGPKIIINKTGSEPIDALTYNEVSTIFDNEISSVIKLIELVNFNENKPENHSFCSTALESPYLSYYNTTTNSINKERKKYFFEDVICKSVQNHEILYSKHKNKFNSIKRKKIEDNILNLKNMKNNSFNSKIIGEMIRKLNLLSYNKRDLIQKTWCGDKEFYESDEEFMKLILDDPEDKNQKNIELKEIDTNSNTDSDSDSDRPLLFPPRPNKSKNNDIDV